MLDYHFPDGRHRDDLQLARWRLQLLGELGVGWKIRDNENQAKQQVAANRRALSGPR